MDLLDKIKEFSQKSLTSGNGHRSGDGDGGGDGYGDGYGNGYGSGHGYGNGNGNGYGSGNGYGNGYGSGHGNGYGSGNGNGNGSGHGDEYENGDILKIDGRHVWDIDGIATIIVNIRNSVARGFILNKDLTETSCYIYKLNGLFAHGTSIREAFNAATTKALLKMPLNERVLEFNKKFKRGISYPAEQFFNYHTILTGSCDLGKETFVRDREINLKKDKFTVSEFIKMTEHSYKGELIQLLKKNNDSTDK